MAHTSRHPGLGEKLRKLYQREFNPRVSNHSALARDLGISRQAISKWIHGTQTSMGNRIPPQQMEALSFIFCITPDWFALPLAEFSQRLEQKSEGQFSDLHRRILRLTLGLDDREEQSGQNGGRRAAGSIGKLTQENLKKYAVETLYRAMHHAYLAGCIDDVLAIYEQLVRRNEREGLSKTILARIKKGHRDYSEIVENTA